MLPLRVHPTCTSRAKPRELLQRRGGCIALLGTQPNNWLNAAHATPLTTTLEALNHRNGLLTGGAVREHTGTNLEHATLGLAGLAHCLPLSRHLNVPTEPRSVATFHLLACALHCWSPSLNRVVGPSQLRGIQP